MTIKIKQYTLVVLQITMLIAAITLLYFVFNKLYKRHGNNKNTKKQHYSKKDIIDDIESARILTRNNSLMLPSIPRRLTTIDPLILSIHDSAVI